MQDGRAVPWTDPRLLYRGVAINAASMAPINGLQFGVNQYLEEMCAEHGETTNPCVENQELNEKSWMGICSKWNPARHMQQTHNICKSCMHTLNHALNALPKQVVYFGIA